MTNSNASRAVKDPFASSGKKFASVIIVILIILAGALFAFTKLAPTKMDNIFNGYENEPVNMSLSYEDGVATLKNNPNENAKTINLYEDFSCKYCAALAESSDAELKKAIESGDIILNVHTLNFLDRGEKGYSTKAFSVARAIAEDEDAAQYWNFRNFLYTSFEYTQGLIGNDDDFESRLVSDLDIDQKYVDAAGDDELVDAANSDASKNIKSLEDLSGKVSSPRVFWDDEEIDVQDPSWVEMVVSAPGSTLAESKGMTQEELEDSKSSDSEN